jgi:hypothetical protein
LHQRDVRFCAEAFGTTVSIYREAQDGGQDAVFQTRKASADQCIVEAKVQCKFSSKVSGRLQLGDITKDALKAASTLEIV